MKHDDDDDDYGPTTLVGFLAEMTNMICIEPKKHFVDTFRGEKLDGKDEE